VVTTIRYAHLRRSGDYAVSARYRGRVRGPDAARLLLAIILIVLTALVAMAGSVPEVGAHETPAAPITVRSASDTT
jgi:hypothetical protein